MRRVAGDGKFVRVYSKKTKFILLNAEKLIKRQSGLQYFYLPF